MKPKLSVELIPSTNFGINVRSRLGLEIWNTLRKIVYHRSGYRCQICGGKGSAHPVEAHEEWEYDHENKIQRLVDILALCPTCHRVKHFGRTVALAKTELGKKNYQEALEKLRTVNCWTQKETRRYIDKAFAQHDEDSKHQWTVDIGFVEQFGVSVPPLDLTRGLVSTSHPPSEDRIENSIQSLAPITRRKKKGKKGGKKRYKRSDYKSPNR